MTASPPPGDPANDLTRVPPEVTIGRLAGLPELPAGDFWITTAQLAALAGVSPTSIATWRLRRATARHPLPADVTLPGVSAAFFRASEAVEWLRARGATPDWLTIPELTTFADMRATTEEPG